MGRRLFPSRLSDYKKKRSLSFAIHVQFMYICLLRAYACRRKLNFNFQSIVSLFTYTSRCFQKMFYSNFNLILILGFKKALAGCIIKRFNAVFNISITRLNLGFIPAEAIQSNGSYAIINHIS